MLAVAAVSMVLIASRDDSSSDDDDSPPATSEAPAATAPASTAPAADGRAASGVKAPAGDLPGWRQIFLDDFTLNVASWGDCTDEEQTCPDLPEPYRSRWWAYPSDYRDTREQLNGDGGFYEPRNLSMADGMLRIQLRRGNGTTQGAAPVPKLGARTYGRYAIRFRADPVPGFKAAWLLWPQSGSFADDGEIDFPEGALDSRICAYMHFAPASPGTQDAFCTDSTFGSGWHTAVVEWTPGRVEFWLDGTLIGTSTTRVPSIPMTWILQSETSLGEDPPADGAIANIHVDWVAAWAQA